MQSKSPVKLLVKDAMLLALNVLMGFYYNGTKPLIAQRHNVTSSKFFVL